MSSGTAPKVDSIATPKTAEGFRQSRFTPPPTATTILLVRHGESAAAVEGQSFPLKDGHGDPPLHPQGRIQADQVGERLRHERIDAIYVTSLVRTHETAAPLARALTITPFEIADLREVFLGEWEGGELRVRAAAGDPIWQRVHSEQRWDAIPGAESATAFSQRLWRGIDQVVANHPGGRVAVFVHGGVVGRILADIVGVNGFAFSGSDNGSISEIVIDGPARTIRRFNDTSHLV
jgi:2,3-bisphosphoglycerate-dependent phosphoglycerate mutase